MIIQVGKIAVRAAVRALALIVAFGWVALPEMGFDALVLSAAAVWRYALVFAGIGLIYDLITRSGRTAWRYTSIHDILIVLRSSTIVVLLFLLAIFVFDRANLLPRSTLILAWGLDIGLIATMLLIRRAMYDKTLASLILPQSSIARNGTPLLLVGGMDGADAFLRDNARSNDGFKVVGLVAQEAANVGRELRGVRVQAAIGAAGRIFDDFAGRTGDKAILFLDDCIAPGDIEPEQLGRLRAKGVRFLRQSRMIEWSEGVGRSTLREINVEELLSRAPVQLDVSEIRELVSGKRVLVTGAGGSIGSEICRQVSALGCAHIALLDSSEFGLFNIDMEIANNYPTLSRADILCDIRDARLVSSWLVAEQPDVIFHAAALKHVPLMENHPCESVLTNVVGTWNVAEAARACGARHMVFISTDKAVEPSSVMGATKRLAESVVRVHQAATGSTRFSVVRFGNVLGSAGSVVPTFKAQIARGGPVTLTHPEIERYFMTIPEAVQLVLHATAKSAASNTAQSGVFVLDMGKPVKIIDLAKRLIELHGKAPGRDIAIEITGLRPGEKLTEELIDSTEEASPSSSGVLHVTDRVSGLLMDSSHVKRLEVTARQGDAEQARRMIFDMLSLVRAVSPSEKSA